MTFLHASLLLGGLIAIAPVLMHLLGRRQPKAILFPAIRFVRQSAVTAQRGWSIKRWLLLALRVLMVCLLALALSSPRVHSSMFATYVMVGLLGVFATLATAVALTAYGSRRGWQTTAMASAIALTLWTVGGTWFGLALSGGQNVAIPSSSGPICVAVVLDTSPSMGYKYHNVTRLEAAKEMALWLMDRLPVGSQIAIVNNDAGVRLNQDRPSANRQLDRTMVEGKATPLIQRISAAIDELRKSDLERREIYVLTDLSAAAWRDADASDLPTKLARDEEGKGIAGENILLQVIDVSVPVDEIRNWSLTNFKLSQQSTVPGGQVTISADVQASAGSANAKQLNVELFVEDADTVSQNGNANAKPKPKDSQLVLVDAGGSIPIQMTIKELTEGTHHAELRLSFPDPLECDNVVYITVEARTHGQTLVVCDDSSDAEKVGRLIDPQSGSSESGADASQGDRMYKTSTLSDLEGLDLTRFSSIVLYNPGSMSADAADRLGAWVDQGGALMIVLASSFESAELLMGSPLANLLPGKVKGLASRPITDRSQSLAPFTKSHPIWVPFEIPIQDIPWSRYAVYRYWEIDGLDDRSLELMRFTGSESPAVIEQVRGQGRILTFAIPYHEPAQDAAPEKRWSELFYSDDPYPGAQLFRSSILYLAAWNKQQLNYYVDETVVLENNLSQFPKLYKLFSPPNEETRVEAAAESLVYNFTRFPGQYRLKGVRIQGPVNRGFSVNIDRNEVSLERIRPEVLDKAIGKGLYRIAKERNDVQSSLGEGRYGRDLSPFLMMLVVMLIMAEQTMASRFYAQTRRAAA